MLARVEAFAAKNTPLESTVDGIAMGIGLLWVLALLGGVREIVGTGQLFGGIEMIVPSLRPLQVLPADYPGFLAAVLPPGAFIFLGLLIAGKNWLEARAAARALQQNPSTQLPLRHSEALVHAFPLVSEIENAVVALAALTLPAASRAVAVTLCEPVEIVVTGRYQTPLDDARAVPCETESINTSTRALASDVPITAPTSDDDTPAAGAVMTGAEGVVLSRVAVTPVEKLDRFPSVSVARSVNVCGPSESESASVRLHAPLPSTSASPTHTEST